MFSRTPFSSKLTLCVILAMISSCAIAERIEYGSIELAISGSYRSTSVALDGDSYASGSDAGLVASLGFFLSPVLELEGGGSIYRDSYDTDGYESETYYSGGFYGAIKVNIPSDGPMLPFMSFGGGLRSYGGDGYGDDISLIFPRAVGGVRVFLSSTASVNVLVAYTRHSNPGGWSELTRSDVVFGIGMSLFVGR